MRHQLQRLLAPHISAPGYDRGNGGYPDLVMLGFTGFPVGDDESNLRAVEDQQVATWCSSLDLSKRPALAMPRRRFLRSFLVNAGVRAGR